MNHRDLELQEKTHSFDRDSQSGYGGTDPGSPCSTTASDDWQMQQGAPNDDPNNDEDKKANTFMTAFNVINSIIGSGIIGMPYSLRQAGVGLGLITLLLVSIMTDYSLNLLIIGGSLSSTATYQDLVRAVFGRPGFLILTAMQGVYPFIAMISYNILIGDTLPKLAQRIFGEGIQNSVIGNRYFIMFLSTLLVTYPLSLYKQIASLVKVSIASTAIIVFVILTMLIRAPAYSHKIAAYSTDWRFANWKVPQAIAIQSFSFMCQHNSYLCYYSLKKRNPDRWNLVVHLAVAFSFLASSLLGLIGYSTFTAASQGDILENYCFQDDLINVSRLLFSITVMLTYPVECFVAREVIENTFFQNYKPLPTKYHAGITALIVTLALGFSMTTNCLGVILELNGILTATPLAFIIPPLVVLRLQHEPALKWSNLGMLSTLGFGIVVALSGVIMLIMDLADGVTCSHGNLMNYCQDSTFQTVYSNVSAGSSWNSSHIGSGGNNPMT